MAHYAHTLKLELYSGKRKAIKAFMKIFEKQGDMNLVEEDKKQGHLVYNGAGAKVGALCFHAEVVLSEADALTIFKIDPEAEITCDYTSHDNDERGGGSYVWNYDKENGTVSIAETDYWQADNDYEFFEKTGSMDCYWDNYAYWAQDFWNEAIGLEMIEDIGVSDEDIIDSLMEIWDGNCPLPVFIESETNQELVGKLKMAMAEQKLEQTNE